MRVLGSPQTGLASIHITVVLSEAPIDPELSIDEKASILAIAILKSAIEHVVRRKEKLRID